MKNNLSFHLIQTKHSEHIFEIRRQLSWLPAGGLILAGSCLFWLQAGETKKLLPLFIVMLFVSFAIMTFLAVADLTSVRMRAALGIAVAFWLIFSILLRGILLKGAAAWMNGLQEWLYLKDGIYRIPFADAGDILPAAVWIAIAFGILGGWILRLHVWQVPAVFLLAVMLLTGSGYIGIIPASLLMSGLFLAMAEVWMDFKAAMRQALPWLVILAALLCAVCIVFASVNSTLGSNLRTKIARTIHHLRYETSAMAMPEGELDGLDAYQPSDTEALEVSMDHWQALYLKGFTGGDYTGNAWIELTPEDTKEEKELLYTLQKNYFFTDTQEKSVLDVLADYDTKDSEHTVTVLNTGACGKYAYVPYGMTKSQGVSLQADHVLAEGTGKKAAAAEQDDAVTFTVLDPQNSYLLQHQLAEETAANRKVSEKAQDYIAAESTYRTFVYEHYLTVPDALQELLKEESLLPTGEQTLSTTDAKYWINGILSKYLTYNENTVTGSLDEDFLTDLIKVKKQGYCVQYASLAVMLLRSMGIPARYAEGYLVTSAQAENLKDGASLHLSQYNAHAWVEYYLDGIGWLVYDPTPGFTDEIDYELPLSDETDDENEGYAALKLSDQLASAGQKIAVKTESKDTTASGNAHTLSTFGTILISAVVTLLLLLLIAFIVHMVVLRRRLKQHLASGDTKDPRQGCAIWLGYTMELLNLSGMPGNLRFLSEYENELLVWLKDQKQVECLIRISEKVWYSGHEVTKEERDEAKACSDLARNIWKEQNSLPKRLLHRFWLCRIL